MHFQRTLKNTVRCTGIGLHSGQKAYLSLQPAPANHGIVFRRTDLNNARVPAHVMNVKDTRLCTTISNNDGVSVSTIEHLLAAFAGMGVDNAIVDIDGPEVPIMDGSAAPFVFLLECAGVVDQNAPKRWIRIKRKIGVKDGDKMAQFEPGPGFHLSFLLDFDHPVLKRQQVGISLTETAFIKEVSRARTFGFVKEVEYLQANGLAKGASLDNAIAIGDYQIINEDGLRYEDEFARHKVMDALGDLYLLGTPIIGKFVGERSGHALNNLLLRALLAQADAWEMVEGYPEGESAHIVDFAPIPGSLVLPATVTR
ncbi:UDP-3-O-[3-hydroxymyristoyl] N-acetylglucosamine deacetylase [Magnetococcus marinus MC-1]|uniref:UDP-3-O-acyl-N-acetylglucosamine deacetylase n=1 Tax=Magnetococcus marinus (strain ATCC BAA-1437 / JCM 17883 / MC-1) TaxID=156889 RepID=A0L5M4_MAGMM|nr:UDP-3-O-acyl-N-acetylglucosamine deacetylase [Magnetococcus marinus]ABK43267.1 UDP-3-O-[3-hydroxymyristoyl] N-acetylglucosamine deacetylase [Magnetococcus marinus MC-1]